MLYAKINVKSNHFLFLTSLESPLKQVQNMYGNIDGYEKFNFLKYSVTPLNTGGMLYCHRGWRLTFKNGYDEKYK